MQFEVPHVVQMEQIRRQEQHARDNPAIAVFEALQEQMKQFRARMQPEEKLAIKLNGDSAICLNVQSIGYVEPSLIYFDGTTADGNTARIMQSLSQLNFAFIAVVVDSPEVQS